MEKARARELLENERARLERLLRAEGAATAPDQGDEVDDANWRIAEETGRAVSRSLRDRWSALQRAQERLERGTYGLSILSGQPIPDERLEADPLAELTVQEAAAEAFRARHSTEPVSGLSSTRRTLAALAEREEAAEGPGRSAVGVEDEEAEEEVDEDGDLDVEELDEDEELIDEDETAGFDEADAEAEEEDEDAEEAEEEEEQEEQEEQEERRPQRRRSGRR